MAEPFVRIASTSVVKPSKPTAMHTMYLSGDDQIMKFVPPNRSILFYKTGVDVPAAIHILKQSLASALVHFYPLAGRVIEDIDGRLALDCNDDGVEVVEAYSDVSIAQLEETDYQVIPFFRKLVALNDRECCNNVNDPLLSLQVTGLVGGLAVGVAISHVAADGYSFWQFLSSLAQLCRGEALSMTPLHARTILWPESFSLNRMHGLEKDVPEPYNGAFQDGSKGFDVMLVPPEKLHQRLLHVSADMLKTLKRVSGEAEKGSFTSFEVLAAYCWKRITLAQGLSDETRCDFRINLDVRSRMIPAPTAAYFGNAVVGITVPTTAGELKRESLGATALRIHEGIRSGDDRYIKQALKTREKMDLRKLQRGGAVLFSVRNASRFGVYKASDMGWGSEAEAVRPTWESREGCVTWYPGKDGGSIDVLWALSNPTLARFFSPHLQAQDPLGAHLIA